MRALTISAHGGAEQLVYREDLAPPELRRPDDVLVRVHAAALNHLDLFMLGGLPHITMTPPWVMGSDGAGVVEAAGPAAGVTPGDRVMLNPGMSCGTCEYCRDEADPLCLSYGILGEHHPGTLADYVVVPGRNVARIPDHVLFTEAAALPLATLTAWRMVMTRAQVRAGDAVLIWGIGGGVAQQALQICKGIGARVWVTSSSDDKLDRARALGADEVINHSRGDVGREIRARTGKRGVDVVVDSVGQATWKQSLGALGKRGRLVTCGGTSGPMVETDVRRLFWNQWTILGSTMGTAREFAAVAAEFSAGRLRPIVDSVIPLAEGRRAFERLASGQQFGKVVVDVRGGTPG
ncbi:MAG: zinc-binding dehydrogenase [Gemmatimonadetes bacterium]|nr:zinc-binding dehydrogenase [Gemmatimonadota bacterium]